MAYVWQRWLADALRAEGCKVREYDGWKDRGRPSSTGAFDPYAVGHHHTGAKSTTDNPCPSLSTCVHGREDLPGPLAHVVFGRDGTCHVIAAGRANHAGESNGNGPLYSGDGNAQMIGFEVDYSGSQDVSDAQANAVILATAAVLRHFHKDESHCRGHKEWSTTGKWDPGRNGPNDPAYDMGKVRGYVRDALAGGMEGDDVAAWVALTTTEDQDIAPDTTEVITFDHEASDSDGAHSEDSWVAAIRPPSGFNVGQFMCRVNVTGGIVGERLRMALVVSPVDEDKAETVTGYDDMYLGDNGAGCHVWSYMIGVGNDRRYRVRLTNYGTRTVTVSAGAELRATMLKT